MFDLHVNESANDMTHGAHMFYRPECRTSMLVAREIARGWPALLRRDLMGTVRQGAYIAGMVEPVDEGLYPRVNQKVTFVGDRLFRATVTFPSNVPTGSYLAQVYYLRDGQMVGAQTTPLFVSRIGMEADIYQVAHAYPIGEDDQILAGEARQRLPDGSFSSDMYDQVKGHYEANADKGLA